MSKRVYHPTLNSWQDVEDAAEWVRSGWVTTKPKHIDDSDALPAPVEKAEPKAKK